MRFFFTETERGTVALLKLSKITKASQAMGVNDTANVVAALAEVSGIPRHRIGFKTWERGSRLFPHPRYDEIANAIMRRGYLNAIHGRIVHRKDTDVLAENQPVSERAVSFYTDRKAWKYSKELSYLGTKPPTEPDIYLRRSGTYSGYLYVE